MRKLIVALVIALTCSARLYAGNPIRPEDLPLESEYQEVPVTQLTELPLEESELIPYYTLEELPLEGQEPYERVITIPEVTIIGNIRKKNQPHCIVKKKPVVIPLDIDFVEKYFGI